MAKILAFLRKISASPWGRGATVLLYIAMLMAICLMFTGNGAFIYEGF